MLTASCFIQLATMVVTFTGQNSIVNITTPGISDNVSSIVIQFKTSQSNTQIFGMMSKSQSFAVNIRSGLLELEYNFNSTGNGSFNLGLVNTNQWFILNITSQQGPTHVHLSENENSISTPCGAKLITTTNITLLGPEFTDLLKASGLKIGGATDDKSIPAFKGCIGMFSLDNHVIDLFNMSKVSNAFKRNIIGTSKGCPCSASPCVTGAFVWDRTRGKCDCKCSIGYHGVFCQNRTMSKVSDDDDDFDSEFIYIVVGVSVGVLLLLICLICVVVYIRRTSSSVFGVYNPKSQEQTQGQQMKTAFTLPIPEKLI